MTPHSDSKELIKLGLRHPRKEERKFINATVSLAFNRQPKLLNRGL